MFLEKYLFIMRSSFKDALFYRSKLISSVVLWVFRVGVLFSLYAYAYRYTGKNVGGISFQVAIWSMAAYFVMNALTARRVYRDISDDVRLGVIETRINKPYNYLLFRTVMRFGAGLPDFLCALVVAIPLLLVFAGSPRFDFSFSWLAQFVLLGIGGILLTYELFSLVGLSAMWLTEADPVFWIVDKSILILGGSFVPVALFPHFVQLISEYTPFGATVFVARAFNPDFSEKWVELVVIQVVWLVVMTCVTSAVYQKASRKLSVNGG